MSKNRNTLQVVEFPDVFEDLGFLLISGKQTAFSDSGGQPDLSFFVFFSKKNEILYFTYVVRLLYQKKERDGSLQVFSNLISRGNFYSRQ